LLGAEKIRLYPTKEQEEKFKQFAGTARFIYNLALANRIAFYEAHGEHLSIQDILEHIQHLKYNTEKYAWIKDTPESVSKQAVKDLDDAFKNFFRRVKNGDKKKGYPKFKRKNRCTEGFYQRIDNLKQVDDTHIKITGIKTPVRIKKNRLLFPGKNPRVTFDGKYWYLSYSFEVRESPLVEEGEIIGIDLGLKKLAVRSDGVEVKNINKTPAVKKLEKRLKRLQRAVSRKYEASRKANGGKYIKTSNIRKTEKKIKLTHRRLKNIRKNHLHQATADIVKTKPYQVVVEDLNIRGMMKNRHLSNSIGKQGFYMFITFLQYKCQFNGIRFIKADRWFPSSKLCSDCGTKKNRLSLSDRIYKCDSCGLVIDRDMNAALNLSNYKAS
jgi:putative transposase